MFLFLDVGCGGDTRRWMDQPSRRNTKDPHPSTMEAPPVAGGVAVVEGDGVDGQVQ